MDKMLNRAFIYLKISMCCVALCMLLIFVRCNDKSTDPRPEEPQWTSVCDELIGNTIQCLTAHPLRPFTLYVGTIEGVFKTEDSGDTWTQRNDGLQNHDIKAILIHAMQPDVVYCGTWGKGVYRSEDGGATWQSIPNVSNLIGSIYQVPGGPDTLWVGSSEGLYQSPDGGKTWRKRWQGGRRVYAICTMPGNTRVMLMGVFLYGFLRSADGGLTWDTANTGVRGSPGASDCAIQFVCDPGSPDRLYAASAGGFVYQSDDQGAQWSSRFDDLNWQKCIGFAIDPNKTDRFYMAMENGKVYRSEDAGASWTLVGTPIEEVVLTTFCLAPGNRNILYVGTIDHGLFRYVE